MQEVGMYYNVEFHADGGQICVRGLRSFDNRDDARRFAKWIRKEPDHTCGAGSVKEFTSETKLDNEGEIYPRIANILRRK